MPVDELNDPVLYSWWVTVGGILLIAAGVSYLVWAVRSTRRRPADRPPPPPPRPRHGTEPFASVRAFYLAKVHALEQRYVAGMLDTRALHLELSAVVREFASVRRGVNARVLTLSELHRVTGAERLAGLIATYYRPAFARHGAVGASAEQAIAGARWVISQW